MTTLEDYYISKTTFFYSLKAIDLFRKAALRDEQYRSMVELVHIQPYSAKSCILQEQVETAPALYVIIAGSVELKRSGSPPLRVVAGCSFGEDLLSAGAAVAAAKEEEDAYTSCKIASPYTVNVSEDSSCLCAILTLASCQSIFEIIDAERGNNGGTVEEKARILPTKTSKKKKKSRVAAVNDFTTDNSVVAMPSTCKQNTPLEASNDYSKLTKKKQIKETNVAGDSVNNYTGTECETSLQSEPQLCSPDSSPRKMKNNARRSKSRGKDDDYLNNNSFSSGSSVPSPELAPEPLSPDDKSLLERKEQAKKNNRVSSGDSDSCYYNYVNESSTSASSTLKASERLAQHKKNDIKRASLAGPSDSDSNSNSSNTHESSISSLQSEPTRQSPQRPLRTTAVCDLVKAATLPLQEKSKPEVAIKEAQVTPERKSLLAKIEADEKKRKEKVDTEAARQKLDMEKRRREAKEMELRKRKMRQKNGEKLKEKAAEEKRKTLAEEKVREGEPGRYLKVTEDDTSHFVVTEEQEGSEESNYVEKGPDDETDEELKLKEVTQKHVSSLRGRFSGSENISNSPRKHGNNTGRLRGDILDKFEGTGNVSNLTEKPAQRSPGQDSKVVPLILSKFESIGTSDVHPTLYSGGSTFSPVKKETTSEEATLKNVEGDNAAKNEKDKENDAAGADMEDILLKPKPRKRENKAKEFHSGDGAMRPKKDTASDKFSVGEGKNKTSARVTSSRQPSSPIASITPRTIKPTTQQRKEGKRKLKYSKQNKARTLKEISSLTAAHKRFESSVPTEKCNVARPPKNVLQSPLDTPLDYKPPVHPKTEKEKKSINGALKNRLAFQNLPKTTIGSLIDAFEKKQMTPETTVIKQGESDDYFYVVSKGECQFEMDGEKVGTVKAGESFGEEALVYTSPREASVVTKTDTDLFRVDQSTFRNLLQSEAKQREQNKRQLLESIEFLKVFSDDKVKKLMPLMEKVNFQKGEKIVEIDDFGNAFYVVTEGKVKCCGEKPVEEMGKGDYWGKTALTGGSPHPKADVFALADGSAYAIDRSKVEKTLGYGMRFSVAARSLHSVDALRIRGKGLKQKQIKSLVKVIRDVTYNAGDTIFKKGENEAVIFVVQQGTVHVTKGRELLVVTPGVFFGQELFDSAKEANALVGHSPCEAKALDDVTCGAIYIRDWYNILGIDFQESIDKTPADRKIDPKISLDNFERRVCLGEGQFGQAWLCSDKTSTTPKPYVLKIISKYHLVSEGFVETTVREKRIMADLNHPLIIDLISVYQDDAFLYMLLDFVPGGELFSLMNPAPDEKVKINESQAKFYALGIADALAYMHSKKYVYRDLKPENILIDSLGYPKIIDFGFAKFVEDYTYTLCGTPAYLAPEACLGQGYNWAADHWALGVLIFEMISSQSPFFKEGIEQSELFRSIIEDELPPLKYGTPDVFDFVSNLLTKKPSDRLGSLVRGNKDILAHSWFSDLNVNDMRERRMQAMWKPKIKDSFDVSNFDDWSSLRDKTLDPGPQLHPRDQAKFDNF